MIVYLSDRTDSRMIFYSIILRLTTVLFRKAHAFSYEVAVIQDIMVREDDALGEARRARRILDVDGVVEVERALEAAEHAVRHLLAHLHDLAPGIHAGLLLSSYEDDRLQEGQVLGIDLAGLRGLKLGADLIDHADIIGRLEPVDEEQGLRFGLPEHVVELVGPVGGVDVDQDDAALGRGELDDDPLGDVGGPDGDPVALLVAQAQQALSGPVNLFLQLCPGVAQTLVFRNERFSLRELLRDLVEHVADRLADERLFRPLERVA